MVKVAIIPTFLLFKHHFSPHGVIQRELTKILICLHYYSLLRQFSITYGSPFQ